MAARYCSSCSLYLSSKSKHQRHPTVTFSQPQYEALGSIKNIHLNCSRRDHQSQKTFLPNRIYINYYDLVYQYIYTKFHKVFVFVICSHGTSPAFVLPRPGLEVSKTASWANVLWSSRNPSKGNSSNIWERNWWILKGNHISFETHL